MLVAILTIVITLLNQTFSYWINDDFIDDINIQAKHWKARMNQLSEFSEQELRNLASLRGYHSDKTYVYPIRKYSYIDVPLTFDARDTWLTCKSISTIRDQGKCGASWAFAAAEVMSDRFCVASSTILEFTFSPEELIGCCSSCGKGCRDGYLFPAFDYWMINGIPSGGDEYTEIGCKPYTSYSGKRTPCVRQCREDYNVTYEDDLRHGIEAYRIHKAENQIQMEIMMNGPVVASMDVYTDFYVYGEGVYEHVTWDLVGRIAVKIIGWGVENDVPYWLIANSWGTSFGENGLVKVLRGSNHCGIEYEVTAGLPNIETE